MGNHSKAKIKLIHCFLTLSLGLSGSYSHAGPHSDTDEGEWPASRLRSQVEVCDQAKKFYFPNKKVKVGSKQYTLKQDTDCSNEEYLHFNSNAWEVFHQGKGSQKPYTLSEEQIEAADLTDHDVRIGSFNFWNLGASRQKFKQEDIIAEIGNQWDILVGIEVALMTTAGRAHNENLEAAIKAFDEGVEIQNARNPGKSVSRKMLLETFKMPGYLKLLKELQKLDPSWALILSPYADADKVNKSAQHTELYGYYYRARKVKPKAVGAPCGILDPSELKKLSKKGKAAVTKAAKEQGNTFACTFKYLESLEMADALSGGVDSLDFYEQKTVKRVVKQQKAGKGSIPREPLVARFASGNFDFTLVSTHHRFRYSKGVNPKDPNGPMVFNYKYFKNLFANVMGGDLDVFYEGGKTLFDYKLQGVAKYKDYRLPKSKEGYNHAKQSFSGETMITRMSETKLVSQWIDFFQNVAKKDGEESDLIFVGDFNLENADDPKNSKLKRQKKGWEHILAQWPGAEVVVNKPSSVSKVYTEDGMTSEYDHFVFNPKVTSECQYETDSGEKVYRADRFNFARPKEIASAFESEQASYKVTGSSDSFIFGYRGPEVVKAMDELVEQAKLGDDGWLKAAYLENEVASLNEVVETEDGDLVFRPYYAETKKQVSKMVKGLAEGLADTLNVDSRWPLEQWAAKWDHYFVGRTKPKFKKDPDGHPRYGEIYHNLFSDHIPIFMRCSVTQKDDDK